MPSCDPNPQAEWIKPDSRPPDNWPDMGSIAIEDFDLKYREGLPLVLKQINCVIGAGEKVNVRCNSSHGDLSRPFFTLIAL